MKRQFLTVILLVLFGCWSPKDCHTLHLVKKFEVPVNNADLSLFSYKEYENDETSTARSIAISPDGKYVFICDAGHDNVKKVNLIDGSIRMSGQLSELAKVNLSLFDIGATDNNVFITTNRGIVILSKDLDYVAIELSSSRLSSFTEFLYVGNDSVSVVSTEKQRKDRSVDQTVLTLVNLKLKSSARNLSIKDYEATKSTHRLGKSYTITNTEQQCEIRTTQGCFKLERSLPDLSQYFEGRNLDFTSKEFVFFDVSSKAVTIFSYAVDNR